MDCADFRVDRAGISGAEGATTVNMSEQSSFEGWAILEIFGHQKYAGYVKTEYYGTACMFRCDVPALEARERVTRGGCRVQVGDDPDHHEYVPPGSTVQEAATPPYTKLFGVGAIYSMTPCDEKACLAAVAELQPRPLLLVSLPSNGKTMAEMPLSGWLGPPDPLDLCSSEDEDDEDDEDDAR
jgi:hypothetical protein